MMVEEDEFLSTKDAAKFLKLSRSTLAKMRIIGTGPQFHKLGRRVLYKSSDLRSWVERARFSSTSEYPQKREH